MKRICKLFTVVLAIMIISSINSVFASELEESKRDIDTFGVEVESIMITSHFSSIEKLNETMDSLEFLIEDIVDAQVKSDSNNDSVLIQTFEGTPSQSDIENAIGIINVKSPMRRTYFDKTYTYYKWPSTRDAFRVFIDACAYADGYDGYIMNVVYSKYNYASSDISINWSYSHSYSPQHFVVALTYVETFGAYNSRDHYYTVLYLGLDERLTIGERVY